MKRILYSCLLIISFCIAGRVNAQVPNFLFYPTPGIPANTICYNATNIYTVYVEYQPNNPAASPPITTTGFYNWVITGPGGANATFTPGVSGAPTNSNITITYTACGVYTVTSFAFSSPGSLVGTVTNTFEIICPGGAGITVATSAGTSTSGIGLCIGESATLTASGAATYTWSNGGSNANPLIVNPGVNTCYTFTGTTIQGCTVSPASAICVSVQAITATLSPASQTMCANNLVQFTVNAGITTGTTVAPGTTITKYEWFEPVVGSFSTITTNALVNIVSDPTASGGNYSVVITHTGVAGTCTLQALAAVVISTSIPVSISPINPSVCPNAALTLTAVSIQTTALTNFTWTTFQNGGPAVVNAFHGKNFTFSPISPIATVTVDVLYGTCPGQATTSIGLLVLTPTLTSSSPSTCPGRSLTLTASGGLSYTFIATPIANPTPSTLIKPTFNTATHTPLGADLPIQYCVNAFSAGCTGTTCIIVDTRVLTPTLVASSRSVCPGTEFTLTANGSGVSAGSNYTFTSNYNPGPTIYTGTLNALPHTPTGTNIAFPQSYTVTIDSAGCQGTASVTVNLLNLTPTLTSSSPSICAGQQLTLTALGGVSPASQYTFMATVPAFINSPTSTVITTNTNSTTHTPPQNALVTTYSVTVDSAGCKGSTTHTVGILNLGPTLTLTTLPLSGSVCPGTSFTINAIGALNYTFTAPPSNAFATGSAPNSTTEVSGSTNAPSTIGAGVVYTVQADSSTCVGSKTIAIHEYKLNPSIIATPVLVCSGQPVVLTASNVVSNPITPNSSVSYTFFTVTPPGIVPSAAGSFSTTHSPTLQTIYGVRVDSAGCTGPLIPPTVTVNIRPDLILTTSTSAASVCPGLSATVSVAAPTTALSYTYSWSQVSGTSQITPPLNTSSLVTYPFTNSTYSINVLDSLGCVGNAVVSVGIDPALSFSINLASSGSTICVTNPPQTVSLTASSTVTPYSFGAINYVWTPTSGITPNTGSLVIGSPTVTTIYNVTGDNGYGCVAQNTIEVYVGQIPTNLTITPTFYTVCPGFTSTLTAFNANTYTWTGSTFTNAIAQQSISVSGGNYTVVGSNGGGCVFTRTIGIITGTALPINVIASSPTTCIMNNDPKYSKPVHLTASGAGTYVWFPYNPLHMTYSLGPQTDVRPPVTTQYTVIGSTSSCAGQTVITVLVIPQFTIEVTPISPAMCIGDSLKLTIVKTGTDAVGNPSAFTYSWTEALNAPPISMSAYFSPTVIVFPQNTTTYTTEVLDTRGCISMPRLVTVTVLPRPITSIAIPTINSIPTNTVCYVGLNPGDPDVTINLTGNNMNTGLPFGVVPNYTWVSPYSAPYNSILTPANNNAVTVSAPIRLLNNSSVVTYTLISGYHGVPGCSRIDTVNVRVIDCRPVRTITFTTAQTNDTICSRNCVTYINQADTMAGGPQTYFWQFSGGSPKTSNEQSPTVCYNFPGVYNVILTVSNPYPRTVANGVPGSTKALPAPNYIKVVDIPNVTIISPGQSRSDTTVRFGQSVNLAGSGAFTYEWAPAYNISSITKPKVTVNPFKTTQYILTGYNSKGCSSSDTINVIVVEDCGEMYVPNAFTPNNDGANDVLYVRGICLQSLTFMVFNRWGEKVFETADQKIGWDGTYKGEEMNTGVFVYRLEGKTYDGKGFSAKGNITLIR